MPPDPHGKAPQPAGGEKRQADAGAIIDFFEQASGLKLYPYQRAIFEQIMALPPGQRMIVRHR